MVMKDIGLKDTLINNPFPIVITERCEIEFQFSNRPNPNNNKYELMLFEYIKGKPLKRNKSLGYWKKGSKFTYHTALDYYVATGKEYMLTITYHTDQDIEVVNRIWICVNE